jgi:hypothetical protein
MGYRAWHLVGLLLLPWPGWGKASPGEERAGQLLIQCEEGRLTAQARAVAHHQILDALARGLHFELRLAGPLEQPRFLAIDRQPWERAPGAGPAPPKLRGIPIALPPGETRGEAGSECPVSGQEVSRAGTADAWGEHCGAARGPDRSGLRPPPPAPQTGSSTEAVAYIVGGSPRLALTVLRTLA